VIKQNFPNSRNCSLNILLKTRLNLKGSYRILSWTAWIWIIRLGKITGMDEVLIPSVIGNQLLLQLLGKRALAVIKIKNQHE